MKFTRYRLFAGFLLAFSLFSIYLVYRSYAFVFFVKDEQLIKLTLKKHFFAPVQKEIVVEIAKTQNSIAQGLSNRTEMKTSDNQAIDALLFIFPEKAIRHFWMKEMLFELDICWLDNLTFVSCQRTTVESPKDDQELTIYSSNLSVNLVLETMPGFFSEEELNSKFFFKWW